MVRKSRLAGTRLTKLTVHEWFFLLSMLVCRVSFRVVPLYFERHRIGVGCGSLMPRWDCRILPSGHECRSRNKSQLIVSLPQPIPLQSFFPFYLPPCFWIRSHVDPFPHLVVSINSGQLTSFGNDQMVTRTIENNDYYYSFKVWRAFYGWIVCLRWCF